MKRKTSRFHYLIKTKTMINCRAILFTLVVLISAQAGAQNLRAGSFNLRYDNPSDSLNNWQYRKNTIAGLIQFHDFDILGTQEGLENQLVQLKGLLPDYEYIGVGREDGKNTGEHSAIFIRQRVLSFWRKVIFGFLKILQNPIKVGMPYCPEYVLGVDLKINPLVSPFIFSIPTLIMWEK